MYNDPGRKKESVMPFRARRNADGLHSQKPEMAKRWRKKRRGEKLHRKEGSNKTNSVSVKLMPRKKYDPQKQAEANETLA